jgi:hypothetical protein
MNGIAYCAMHFEGNDQSAFNGHYAKYVPRVEPVLKTINAMLDPISGRICVCFSPLLFANKY